MKEFASEEIAYNKLKLKIEQPNIWCLEHQFTSISVTLALTQPRDLHLSRLIYTDTVTGTGRETVNKKVMIPMIPAVLELTV